MVIQKLILHFANSQFNVELKVTVYLQRCIAFKRCSASFVKPADSLPIYQLIAYITGYKSLPINLKESEFSYCFQIAAGVHVIFSFKSASQGQTYFFADSVNIFHYTGNYFLDTKS